MGTNMDHVNSIKLIAEMISEAKNSFSKNSSKSMSYMGWYVTILALCNFAWLLFFQNSNYSYLIWLLMAPISLFNSYINKKKHIEKDVITHFQKIILCIWNVYVICIILLLCIIFLSVYFTGNWIFTLLIIPLILTLTGFAQYITGITCKFKPYTIGAFVFWGGALISILLMFWLNSAFQFIVLAICMVLGFVIPSHMLQKIVSKNV